MAKRLAEKKKLMGFGHAVYRTMDPRARVLKALSRDLAARSHYPAIDVLQSVSRTMPDVTEPEHREKAAQVREWLALLRDSEDLINVGAYVAGSNPRIDAALAHRQAIETFLCQGADTTCVLADAIGALQSL